jgi:SAM-dependent methyltransferase
MIDTVMNMGQLIPTFLNSGNAARFIQPFALEVCKGKGYDIGSSCIEWALPGSIPIDPSIDERYNDMNLPDDGEMDYIFSSHCLEHVDSWVNTLRYWETKLKSGGTLFLYLPSYDKVSWRPWINWSHKHILTPDQIKDFLEYENTYSKIFISKGDLLHSFSVMCEKK